MERGGDGGGALTSDVRHRGMLVHYSWASVHLQLSSFGYKYGTAPHGFTYACPLPTLDLRDLNCARGARVKVQRPIVPGQAVPSEPARSVCKQQPPARLGRQLQRRQRLRR